MASIGSSSNEWTWLLLTFTLLVNTVQGFYLPGTAPHFYKLHDEVPLNVNVLRIKFEKTIKLMSVVTYDYYDERFHFCHPKKVVAQSENLGAMLFGDRLKSSPFELNMLKDVKCQRLCDATVPSDHASFINGLIKENYAHDWLVDGFPVRDGSLPDKNGLQTTGFKLGQARNAGLPNFHNHYDITVEYHTTDDKNYLVVGAKIIPKSKLYPTTDNQELDCTSKDSLSLSETDNSTFPFTYSVTWQKSDMRWATRWDGYLAIGDTSIHWFNLVFASLFVLLLVGIVATILTRTLNNDITRYNQIDLQEDIQEDFGWKLVHGDVFRSPSQFLLLSVLTGSGIQLTCMAFTTLVFASLGFLSPSMRGSLLTALVTLFMLFGFVSGFVSARLYKMFGGESWKSNMMVSATLVPGVIFTIFVILNFFLLGSGSSSAVPVGTMFSIIALWFLLSIPLSFAGSYFGFKKARVTHPIRTNQIPRQVPDQPFQLRSLPSILAGGILPFLAIFTELYYIMNSLWYHKLYYMFGFLFIVFLLLLLICSTVTVVLCYFHLCSENYHWWWRSFLAAGSTALYVFCYAVLFYFGSLNLQEFSSTVIYFGWTLVLTLVCFLMTGAVGFLSCHFFIRKIYSSIKID